MTTSDRLLHTLLEPSRLDPAEAETPTFRLISTPMGGHRLLMAGELDFAARDRLRRTLATLPPSPEGQTLVLDLTGVTYLDCATVKVLLETRHSLSPARPVTFQFAERGQPRRILMLLGLEEAFGLPPTPPALRFAEAPASK